MLADVIGSYLETLEEREFDAPFFALLRARHFYDIHFLHGPFEFGKDFIAKRNDGTTTIQYAFQTKAGNIDLGDWNKLRGQIDLLRTDTLAHPNFDKSLTRRSVLVTTGRLIGGASLAAQEYGQHLGSLKESSFETWDREILIDIIKDDPEIGLAGSFDGQLLFMIGTIETKKVVDRAIEEFSRRWCVEGASLWKSSIEASVLCQRLRREDRLDLACYLGLCLVRGSWPKTHGRIPPDNVSQDVADVGRALFRYYAEILWARCGEQGLDPKIFIENQKFPHIFVTYPLQCLRLIEYLGLLGILYTEDGKREAADRVAEYLTDFISSHPGSLHLVSDRWAVSLIPPTLLLKLTGRASRLADILTTVIRWVSDRYDRDFFGLASPHASPEEELNYLLGGFFEHVDIQRRNASYISTVILDLAAVFELSEVYSIARNDFLAVKAMPCLVESADATEQYALDSRLLTWEPNIEYSEDWQPSDEWKLAPHHKRNPGGFYLSQIGRNWDHLAISSVLRDRHFVTTCRKLIETHRV